MITMMEAKDTLSNHSMSETIKVMREYYNLKDASSLTDFEIYLIEKLDLNRNYSEFFKSIEFEDMGNDYYQSNQPVVVVYSDYHELIISNDLTAGYYYTNNKENKYYTWDADGEPVIEFPANGECAVIGFAFPPEYILA